MNKMKKFKNSSLYLLSSGILVVLLISLGIYGLFSNKADELPPSLPFDYSMFQGLLRVDDARFFKFSETEISNAINNDFYKNSVVREGRQIQFFYSENEISVENILKSIVPQSDNKFVFAFYDARVSKWYTYPKGPYKNTLELSDQSIKTFKIPAGYAFVIAGERNFRTVNLKHSFERPNATHFEIDDLNAGWSLLAIKNEADFSALIDSCPNRIKALWIQKNTNIFERIQKSNPRLNSNKYLVWWLLDNKNIECPDLSADSGGDFDETTCEEEGPVCDSEGVWYKNVCEATLSDATVDENLLATENELCVDLSLVDTGNMPIVCNPLVEAPVCDNDGVFYKNICLFYLKNPDSEVPENDYKLDLENKTCLYSTVEISVSPRDPRDPLVNSDGGSSAELGIAPRDPRDPLVNNGGGSSTEISVAPRDPIVVDGSGSSSTGGISGNTGSLTIEESSNNKIRCLYNDPVCSSEGFYFDNICLLSNSGFVLDDKNAYLPIKLTGSRFSRLINEYCVPVEAVVDSPAQPESISNGCEADGPICSKEGVYYDDICKLIDDGKEFDNLGRYITEEDSENLGHCLLNEGYADSPAMPSDEEYLIASESFNCIESRNILETMLKNNFNFRLSDAFENEYGSSLYRECFIPVSSIIDEQNFPINSIKLYSTIDSIIIGNNNCCNRNTITRIR